MSSYDLEAINYSYVVGTGWAGGTGYFPYLRDVGIMAWGTQDVSNQSGLKYNLALVNGTGYTRVENNKYKDIVARLAYSYRGCGLGVSHYNGRKPSPAGRANLEKVRTGLDFEVDKDPFLLRAEYAIGRDDTVSAADDINSFGYYALAGYRVWSGLQPVVKYDFWDSNSDRDGNEINKVALGLNCLIPPAAKIQVFYEIKNEPEAARIKNNDFIIQWGMTF